VSDTTDYRELARKARLAYPSRTDHFDLFQQLADAIDAQAREIQRLRAALKEYVYETTHLSPQNDDGSHWCKISKDVLANAREALKRQCLTCHGTKLNSRGLPCLDC
jgi:hypothetical protein